jgi:uncharacterized membrane protein YedE/YeeE
MSRSAPGLLTALLSGVIFGFGLAFARMTDPQKIKDFLDLAAIPAGGWDPSLAFVMGGGLIVAFIGLRLDRYLRKPLAAPDFVRGKRSQIDRPLIAGAAIFGIGWGLSGFCPGPAIADLGIIPRGVLLFAAAMLVGSWVTAEVMEWSGRGAPRLQTADAAAE